MASEEKIPSSSSTSEGGDVVNIETLTSSLFQFTEGKNFLWEAIRKSIETHMYSQKVFRGNHTQYGYVNNEEYAIRCMVAKLITPYYKKNVVEGEKNKYRNFNRSGVREKHKRRQIRKYNIIGSNFLVPWKRVPGLFVYITIAREFNKSSGEMDTLYTITFIGRKHCEVSNAFENRYLRILLELNNTNDELSVVDHGARGVCIQRFMPYRDIDSVFIDQAIKKTLINALRRFEHPKTRNLYDEIQEPYHFNILLHGTPGTGKNSLIFALASYFNRNIERVQTSFFSDESGSGYVLISLSNELNLITQSVVVFDEIDLVVKNRELETLSTCDKTNLSMVLQYLDEVADGNIVICCTNHKDRLDPALIRKGRINLEIELRDWNKALLEEALSYHHLTIEELNQSLDEPVDWDNPELKVNPATMMEGIRRCRLEKVGIMENCED